MPVDTYYTFGNSSFSNFVWINGGAGLENPTAADVEMINGGAFALEAWQYGALVGSDQRDNPIGGWHAFDFRSAATGDFTLPEGTFSFRFKNLAAGTRQVRGGTFTMTHKRWWEKFRAGLQALISRLFSR